MSLTEGRVSLPEEFASTYHGLPWSNRLGVVIGPGSEGMRGKRHGMGSLGVVALFSGLGREESRQGRLTVTTGSGQLPSGSEPGPAAGCLPMSLHTAHSSGRPIQDTSGDPRRAMRQLWLSMKGP